MTLISKVLKRNTSPSRIAGFILSNFMGLLIVCGAIQFYSDSHTIWDADDSFVSSDYLVINKEVTAGTMMNGSEADFSDDDIRDLESQPWTREVGRFRTADFRIDGLLNQGGRSMSTALFFESIPDQFLDTGSASWRFRDGDTEIPVIIPKDYLTLYNFGFAGAAGMPRLSEQLMQGVPLMMHLRGASGEELTMPARIVGFSNRINTILVPDNFLAMANSRLGNSAAPKAPTRLIIKVSSPGDVAISQYLESHGYERAGDSDRGSAAFLLKIVSSIVGAIGVVITIMSLFILLLSISLLMEKNREKIHSLLMLGVSCSQVARPFNMLASLGCGSAALLSLVSIAILRSYYLSNLEGLGAEPSGFWVALLSAAILSGIVLTANVVMVSRRVAKSWGNR